MMKDRAVQKLRNDWMEKAANSYLKADAATDAAESARLKGAAETYVKCAADLKAESSDE